MSAITVTFCDVAENHVGMQRIGSVQKLPLRSLSPIVKHYRKHGFDVDCYLLDERGTASVIVVRSFLSAEKASDLFAILRELDWDKKALFDGVVKNKRKRYNLCFADFAQEPCYAEGRGRVIDFASLPELDAIRRSLDSSFCDALQTDVSLVAEGNYYYNKKCSIAYHGDEERNVVIGLRLGEQNANLRLCFRWYKGSLPVSTEIEVQVRAGDIYFMSEKAVGKDWRTAELAVRHSAYF